MGQPAARLGDATLLGGPIVQGSSGVMIGAPNGRACSVCPGGMATGNPVNPMLGAKVLVNEVDMALPGDLNFIVSRSYSSYKTPTPAPVGIYGPGWQAQSAMSLTVTQQQIILHDTAGRSLTFEALTEGGIGYSQSENVWLVRGGTEKLAVKGHALTLLWESVPLAIRLDRDYYFFANNLLGPMAVLGYVSPYVPDNQKALPQPLSPQRILLMEADRFGYVIRYDRHLDGDFKGQIYKVTDGNGRIFRLEYEKLFPLNTHKAPKFGYGDDSGVRLKAIYLTGDPVYKSVPDEPLVSYDYTQKGELMTVFDRSGGHTRSFHYDDKELGRMVGHNYVGRPVTNYQYDANGKVIKQENPQGLDYEFIYEPHATVVKDSLGRKDRYEFEGEGGLKRLVKHVRKDGSITRNEFDQHGRMIAQYDALNRKTEFELDVASGLLIKTITHDGREFTFGYNKLGLMTSTKQPNGQTSKTTFDDLGRMVEQKNGLGETSRYHYEGKTNRLSAFEDTLGKQKTMEWTLYGQIKTFTDCSGKTTAYEYAQRGMTIHVEHEEGLFEKYRYNTKMQLISSENNVGDITQYQYNEAGDVTRVILPNQQERIVEYDAWANVLAQSFGGITQRFSYDRAHRMIALTNENGAQMQFKYDVMDRLAEEIGFDGRTKKIHYDPLGRITDSQDVSIISRYHYDNEDRLKELLLSQNDHVKKTNFNYGRMGLQACFFEENNRKIGVQYAYDKLGRIAKESQIVQRDNETLWQHEIKHEYNKLGLRETSELDGLPPVHYQTYGSGYFIGLILGKTGLVDFERDDLHRETERRFGALTLQSQYNERGELGSVISRTPNHSPLNRTYQYDQIGQLTTTLTHRGEINYQYDLNGRLTKALSAIQDNQYDYDAAGNILPKGMTQIYAVFDNNRVTEDDNYHYHYDAFGNLTEKKHKLENEIHHYQYDLEHRLIRYRYHNQNSNEHRESHYQYDPFGRRIKKSIKDNDTKNEKNYWYGWDGDRLVTTETESQRINTIYHPNGFEPLVRIEQALPLTPKVKTLGEVMEDEMGMKLPKLVTDQFNEVEEAIRKDQLSAEQVQWLEGMMLNQESISEYIPKTPKRHPLQIHYYHCDQVGTPLALISDTGTIDWAIELDPFGNVLAENGSDKIYQPIRMQGQQYDEETGLHYNRYRYYDPQTGRYISQDPIGLQGGMNNYTYPLNPNQAVDPLGLQGWEAFFNQPGWQAAASKAQWEAENPPPKGKERFIGERRACEFLRRNSCNAGNAWQDVRNHRWTYKGLIEEDRNAEHYLYALKSVKEGDHSWTMMNILTSGYTGKKMIWNGLDRVSFGKFKSDYRGSPATWSENLSGHLGADDALLKKDLNKRCNELLD